GAIQPKSIGKITKKDNKLQAKEISATEKQVIQRKANPQAATPSPHAKGGGTASPENDAGFQGVTNRIKQVAQKEKTHPPATTKSTEAQAAAVPPSNEVTSKAQNRQVEEMNQQQPGKFNAAAFKAALMEKIAAITPQTLEEADNFKNNNKIESVKGDLSSQVSQEKKQAANPIEDKAKEAPNPSGIPAKPVTPLPPNQLGAPTPDIGASNAAPKPKSEAEVSLKEGSQSLDKQMTDAKVTEEQLAKSNEPQFQGALDAKKTAQTQANTAPPIYRQEEKATLTKAGGEAQIAAQTQLQGMHGEHAQILAQVLGTQGKTKGQDEQKRAEVANHIQGIYNSTKQNVEKSLGDLDKEVNQEFDQGTAAAKTEFENYVKQRMDTYKEERYSGVIGAGKWVKDKLFGMPSEVNVFYQEGKKQYLASMGKTIDKIANLVATKLNTAKSEIAKGKQDIQKYVASLPQDLRQVGQEAAQNIQGQFDELEQSVDNKQNELVDSLAQKYNDNLQAIDAKIEEMKAENRGLVDKATDAIAGTIKTIMQLKDMLMGVLAKAASAVEKIILDPIGFLGNLVSGIRQGFDNFVGNIITHLQTGLMGWLTGAMGALGLQLPDDIFSLQGIFSLVTQILGTTWNYIRMKAVKMFGEPIVKGMEKTVEIFQIIANKGPMGLWEHVQEHFNDLKETVIEEIKGMLITQVITAGVKWIIGLLNPASAFVKAAMAIYDIVMFFINQGSQVVELVSAVTDAVVAIASGAVGGAAKLVENALAKSLPVVIGFLASLLGIGDLAKKVQGIVGKIRQRIDLAIDKVLQKAKSLFKGKKGKGNEEKEGKEGESDERSKEEKEADLNKAVGDADKIMQEEDATPDSVKKRLPIIKSKYRLTSLELVKDTDTEYHIEAKINPEKDGQKHKLGKAKGGSFNLAPGGFQAHEGDILSSEGDGKQVHLLTKHGKDVISVYLKERLEEPLKVFRQERAKREQLYKDQIQNIRSTIKKLWSETTNAKPDKVEKIINRIQGENGLDAQIQNIQAKLQWLVNIKENNKEAIEHALNVEWRLNITFRATKFYNQKIMEKAVMEALKNNQQKIDEGFTDEQGNSKDVGATLRPPIKHKLPQNIGVGYELNSNMEAVEIGPLTQVVVIIVISDAKKRLYKVETAYPEP
ncbi:MAG TPA: hypothetical protein DD000_00705, partial [Cyanobacteria bacterium UBA11166]|nr:hypothetical protein [Cyanobacteria bacterium UBA11166]